MKPIPDKLNKITPGCMAYIVGHPLDEFNNLPVICGNLIIPGDRISGFLVVEQTPRWWWINKPIKAYKGGELIEVKACPESNLIPISGDQFLNEEEKEQVRDLYRVRFTSGDMTCK